MGDLGPGRRGAGALMLSRLSGKLGQLRWKLIHSLTPRRTVHSRGLHFTLACDNPITSYRWSSFNTKEPETLDWIDKSLGPTDVLFDVGANVGVYSLYAALRHPGLRVVCFEPEYSNLHLLRDNVAANHLQDVIDVYSIGLSAVTGISHLHVQDLTPGAALHSESRSPMAITHNGQPVVYQEGIWAMKLDDFVEATGIKPTALKIDVDGTELDVLQGAVNTVAGPAMKSLLVEMDSLDQKDARVRELLARSGLSNVFQKPDRQYNTEIWERETKPEFAR